MLHGVISNNKKEAKAKNAFANNMSTDIKLSKPKFPKIIQSCRFLGNIIVNLCKKTKIELAVSLTKNILRKLATKPTLS